MFSGYYMKINNKEINIDDLADEIVSSTTLKKIKNDIYLNNEQIDILKKYDINYQKYNSLSNLIFDIEEILNEDSDMQDLEEVSRVLSELNYYNNTKK